MPMYWLNSIFPGLKKITIQTKKLQVNLMRNKIESIISIEVLLHDNQGMPVIKTFN